AAERLRPVARDDAARRFERALVEVEAAAEPLGATRVAEELRARAVLDEETVLEAHVPAERIDPGAPRDRDAFLLPRDARVLRDDAVPDHRLAVDEHAAPLGVEKHEVLVDRQERRVREVPEHDRVRHPEDALPDLHLHAAAAELRDVASDPAVLD